MAEFDEKVGHVSDLTVADIQVHLMEMKQVYDITRNLPPVELYTYFRTLEVVYMSNPGLNNYCATVHRLHPVKYNNDFRRDEIHDKISFSWSLGHMLTCLKCSSPLSFEKAFDVHILNKSYTCDCGCLISYEQLTAKAMERRWNACSEYCGNQNGKYEFVVEGSSSWKGFCKPFGSESEDELFLLRLIHRFRDNMSSVSMDLIKGMYRQMDFLNKICCNFEYWNQPAVLQESVDRYNKFMNLCGSEHIMVVPTMDIDLAWHTHQTHHNRYLAYCLKVNNNHLIDHDDTISSPILADSYSDTFLAWYRHYGEPYSHSPPKYYGSKSTSWAESLFELPTDIYRMIEWKLYSAPKPYPEGAPTGVAIVGTPVNDSSMRPKHEVYEASVYVSLREIDKTANAKTRGCGGLCFENFVV